MGPNKEKSLTRNIQCQILPTTQGRRNINIGITIPLNRMEMNTTKLMLWNQHYPILKLDNGTQWRKTIIQFPLWAETEILNKMLSNWVRVSKLVSSQKNQGNFQNLKNRLFSKLGCRIFLSSFLFSFPSPSLIYLSIHYLPIDLFPLELTKHMS